MFSATRECPRCGGTGFRPLLGPFHVRCRPCKGTGRQIRLAARIWWLIRFGSGEE
jgi:DnaJ-class molecular chaperone